MNVHCTWEVFIYNDFSMVHSQVINHT